MQCNVCDDFHRDVPKDKRHVDKDLKEKLKRLWHAIERLDERNWMDEAKLRRIGEGFDRIRQYYKARWRESACSLGGWKDGMPWGMSGRDIDMWFCEGVRVGQFFQ